MSFKELTLEDVSFIQSKLSDNLVFKEGGIFSIDQKDCFLLWIQGYDTSISCVMKFFPPIDLQEYRGSILVSGNKYVNIQDCSYPLETLEEGVGARNVVLSKDKPLEVLVNVHSSLLDDPPVQAELYYVSCDFLSNNLSTGPMNIQKKYETTDTEIQLLKELRMDPFCGFSFQRMLNILEWMRSNIKYDLSSFKDALLIPIKEFIELRRGRCLMYADLFAHMVYLIGGISRVRSGPTYNLIVDNSRIASASSIDYASHRWTEVYYENRWHVVDPTIYSTSPDYNKTRAIDRLKKIYGHEIKEPHVILLDLPERKGDKYFRTDSFDREGKTVFIDIPVDLRVKADSRLLFNSVKNIE